MIGTIAVIGALLLLLAWFFWPSDSPTRGRPPRLPRPPRPVSRPGVDERELEEAEREVQEAPDEETVRDWGPGVQKPPLP
jgi:hypothetical protein